MATAKVSTDYASIPLGDYVSEGLAVVMPDSCFPNMVIGDKFSHPWPYLRREINHNWYCDRRAPIVGFLNRDEAILLHNLALQFQGKPALEIGSWMGWSTCHLALAGVALDVIDPILADPEHLSSIRDSLAAAGVLGRVTLYASESPAGVRELSRVTGTKWNFFFIDGNHEGTAPARDAAECVEHAAQDALIVFHDLTSPDVEEGLKFLQRQGWDVLIYQTMQIMGVAWRGAAKPVSHKSDPSIAWTLPRHLDKYPISGAPPDEDLRRLSRGMAWRDEEIVRLKETAIKSEQSNAALLSAGAVEIHRLSLALADREAELQTQRDIVEDLTNRMEGQQALLHQAAADLDRLKARRDEDLERLYGEIAQKNSQIRNLVSDVDRFSRENLRIAADIKELQWTSDAVKNSVSWKITRPLRRAKASKLAPKVNELLRGAPRRMLRYVLGRDSSSVPDPDSDNREQMVPLFDAEFYREMNPDIAQTGMDPLQHYMTCGAREGRDPHPLFDTSFYCEMNPHVRQMQINPLLHFISQGANGERDPHPLFSTWFYRTQNPDVVKAGINPLVHYIEYGAAEGRDPHPLFDTSFYRDGNPDVVQAGMNPLAHYILHGGVEGRSPHPLFDATFYLATNPDVEQAKVNPLSHYLTHGAKDRRDPHPLFDTSFHIEQNPDVAQAGINPLVHYAIYGAVEDRDPHPLFDTSFYREQKPQVRTLGINPLVHFLSEGPTAEFDPLTPTPNLPDTGICIVTPDVVGPVKNGGIGTACYHYARVLAEAGHPVSVFFTGDLTDCQRAHWRNTYAKLQIKFITLSDTAPVTKLVYGTTWFYERSWRVFEYLRKARFSIVHFQDWQANGFWSIKAKQVGLAFGQTTLTVMTHSCTRWINEGMQQFAAEPFETAKLVWAETYCIERCDALLSPSRYMMEWARGKGITLPPKTVLTPYAWSHRHETDNGIGAPVDNDHLIFFGRLETRKGLHIFSEALRQLQREGVPLPRRLSFLGKHASVLGASSADYLEDLRRDLPTIEFRIINDFDYLQALNYIRETRGLVVICPIMDNYPLTVIECIESKLPFLASTAGGIPEMIDPRISFEPTVLSLANCLKTRETINHGEIRHQYSPSLAATLWHQLHTELLAESTLEVDTGSVPAVAGKVYPKVSVCIPYFNHTQYLQNLVMEFARQGYPALEIILVNDGSGPQAAGEFNRVARNNRDARFRFLTTENRGPGMARNHAAESSTGELLVFFDADNVPKDTSFVSTLVAAIQHCGADCVTSPYDIVGAEKILLREEDTIATYRPVGPCLEAGFLENVLGDATMIIRRSAFEKLGGFPTSRNSWEDHEFLLNLCFLGLRLETFPEATFFYRQSRSGRNQQANAFQNYQSLFERLQSAPSEDLARIITAVGAPMLLGRPGGANHGVPA